MEPIPNYGDHMTIEEFREYVRSGLFTDYDGMGYYATATEISDEMVDLSEIKVGYKPEKYTYVVWFNKQRSDCK
jgi:hypothetical protein